jgi:hypothetical protein
LAMAVKGTPRAEKNIFRPGSILYSQTSRATLQQRFNSRNVQEESRYET